MDRDYEDIRDLENLSDEELRDLVQERLREHPLIDADDITVSVERGRVTLEGRVGTEVERRVARRIVTDAIGISDAEVNLVVDPIRRSVSPEAIDEHLVDERERSGALLGDRPRSLSPEAEHLVEDTAARAFGTTDVQRAIEEGMPWVPPREPTPEGNA